MVARIIEELVELAFYILKCIVMYAIEKKYRHSYAWG